MRWGKRMEAIGNMHKSACSSVIFLTSRRGDFLEMVLWGDHWTRVHPNEYGEDSSGHQPVTSDQWPGSDFTIDFTIKIYYRDIIEMIKPRLEYYEKGIDATLEAEGSREGFDESF